MESTWSLCCASTPVSTIIEIKNQIKEKKIYLAKYMLVHIECKQLLQEQIIESIYYIMKHMY
jgi:hypothetical protein